MMTALQQPRAVSAARYGLAATASPDATNAAMETLALGGNAVDAAIAAAWALCVCEPSGSGLGGHTVLMLRRSSGVVIVIEGQSRAPDRASLDTITSQGQRAGYRATTVPSTPATLGYAQKCFGWLPAHRVFDPAIRLAERGSDVTPLLRKQIGWTKQQLKLFPSAANLLLPDGDAPEVGKRLRQPALARSLEQLALRGTDDFYLGRMAARIVEDMQRNDGLIDAQDLAAAVAPAEREPIAMEYRGHRVLSVPSPGGGPRLFKALHSLELLMADPATDVRGASADLWYSAIATAVGSALDDPACETALRSERQGETTHLCVADAEGNIVTLTQSIQSLFGAKVANAELGFFYNNYLCTCPRFAHPSQLRSRCQPRSNVAPALVFKNERPFLALGSAGSRRIISSLLQVISGVIDRGLGIGEAVSAPRVHALASRRLWIEAPAVTDPLLQEFSEHFKKVKIKPALSFKMGAVQAIQFGADGSATGAADPRRDGTATSMLSEV